MNAEEYVNSIASSTLWDVEVSTLDVEKHHRFLISRVMDRGTMEDVEHTFSFYGLESILDALKSARYLEPKTISYFARKYRIPFEEFRSYQPDRVLEWNP